MGIQLRILLSMLLVIVLSLTGTVAVAWRFASHQDAAYNEQRLKRKETAVRMSLQYALDRTPGRFLTANIPEAFSDRICELGDIHGMSIALYSPSGGFIMSSVPSHTSDSSAPLQLDDAVLELLRSATEGLESVDFGTFTQAYWQFKNTEDEVVGIANLRYEKRAVETGDFIGFLSQLAPLYVILFLGGGILSALLSNRLVRVLRMIGDRMRALDPSAEPTPIEYESRDVIGELVDQYNQLLGQLHRTVEELAQREREGAWRLMAMQVAHEIKNPLTPLKLGVQQLERAWKDGQPDFDKRLERFTETAVAQIEVLSGIARDFSLLAEIGMDDLEPVGLERVVKNAVSLFEAADSTVIWQVGSIDERAVVLGSYAPLVRVLNNLISNSLDAIMADDKPQKTIQIRCFYENNGWALAVEDNGIGMDMSCYEQVFEPRFTTKKSGTGLGLSMSQSIVNQLNGKIHVDSILGVKSVFTVWLPEYEA